MQKISSLTLVPASSPVSNPTGSAETKACEKCLDGWIETGAGLKPCDCRRQKADRKLLARIPPEYRSLSLETIKPDVERHPAQARVIPFLKVNPERSYYFSGRFGCGKTLFGWVLYRSAIEAGRPVVGMPLPELLDELRDYEADREAKPTLQPKQLMQDETRYLIFLDAIDFARPTGYAAEMLYRIVDAAYTFRHQLIVTSNLNREKLAEHWGSADRGPAILRRILEIHGGYEEEMF